MTTNELAIRFESLRPKLMGFSMKLTKNRSDAQDLLQDAFLKAFKSIDKLNDQTNLGAWMMTIIRNTFVNGYRKLKVRTKNADKIKRLQSREVLNTGFADIAAKRINDLMDRHLPVDQSEPFRLFVDGYKYEEIAEMMNVPIGTIKSRIYYARKQMRVMLYNDYRA